MDEKNQRKTKSEEKDYFSGVIICQFFLCLVLSVGLFIFGRGGSEFSQLLNERISSLLSQNSLAEDIISAMSAAEKLFQGDSLAVFGSGVTDAVTNGNAPKKEQEALAVGGDDIEVFEATEKTSFAPYVTTDKLLNPIENGRYTSYFGYRTNPITGKWSFHTGLDIAAGEGTRIRSALSGKVTTVGEDSRAGKYIIVTHSEGFQTFYCHCSEILAEEGMNLLKGETIALVGTTGWSTGPHLHFEVRRNGIRMNPLWALENDC